MLRLLLIASLAPWSQLALAAPQQLAPSGKWIVDFADQRCLAIRNFGTATDPVLFMVKPSPVSDVVQISLVEEGVNEDGSQEKAKLAFGKDAPVAIDQLRYGADKKRVRLINLPSGLASRLATIDELGWSSAHAEYRLKLGPMANVMKVVGQCRDSLREHWNITPERQALLKSGASAVGSLPRLFNSNDYPSDALRQDKSGLASIVLLIDEKGGLADCMIDQTSGVAVLDAQTCIILRKRAKFRPAIGADGKPLRGTLATRVRWMMP